MATAKCLRGKMMYQEGGNLVPFAEYLERGYFAAKSGEKEDTPFPTHGYTPEGLAWVAKRHGRVPLEGAPTVLLVPLILGRLL